jgi:C4-dicarboxylate transporter DctQ subunit
VKKALIILQKVQNGMVALLMICFILVVLIATFCRFFQIMGLKWPDELARYLMMWMVFIGCGTAAREGSHFTIDLVYAFLPKRTHNFFIFLSTLVVDIVLGVVVYLSINMTRGQMRMQQVSPALQLPMWFMYLAVPFGCALVVIQGTLRAGILIRRNREESARG